MKLIIIILLFSFQLFLSKFLDILFVPIIYTLCPYFWFFLFKKKSISIFLVIFLALAVDLSLGTLGEHFLIFIIIFFITPFLSKVFLGYNYLLLRYRGINSCSKSDIKIIVIISFLSYLFLFLLMYFYGNYNLYFLSKEILFSFFTSVTISLVFTRVVIEFIE